MDLLARLHVVRSRWLRASLLGLVGLSFGCTDSGASDDGAGDDSASSAPSSVAPVDPTATALSPSTPASASSSVPGSDNVPTAPIPEAPPGDSAEVGEHCLPPEQSGAAATSSTPPAATPVEGDASTQAPITSALESAPGAPDSQPPSTADAGAGATQAPFTFFAFGDAHAGQQSNADEVFAQATRQMAELDPNAVAAFNNGDLVEDSTDAAWLAHDAAIDGAGFIKSSAEFGSGIVYLAATDNHDRGFPFESLEWLDRWNMHLPAQAALGHTGTDGIYYSVTYQDSLFIVLDSQHPSSAQTAWLKQLLASPEAQAASTKIAFFHQPVYPCTNEHPAFADGLAWVDLFEQSGVKLSFVSHQHMYQRTCALRAGKCNAAGDGVVYQELGPVAAQNFRQPNLSTATVTGVDAEGSPRSDSYACSGADSIVQSEKTDSNPFCHVTVSGCMIEGECYLIGESTPFDTWQVDECTLRLDPSQ